MFTTRSGPQDKADTQQTHGDETPDKQRNPISYMIETIVPIIVGTAGMAMLFESIWELIIDPIGAL